MKITIAGGDRRMSYVSRSFGEKGYVCEWIFNSKGGEKRFLKDTDVLILPFPYIKNGVLNAPFYDEKVYIPVLLSQLNEETLILGGGITENKKNIFDYAKREDFLIKNAVLTAEAAVEIAMQELNTSLFGANAVIFGYGRIGSHLAQTLKSFGANTYIAARRQEVQYQAKESGHNAFGFEDIKALLRQADIVFNTVPYIIGGEQEVCSLKDNVPFIDLASGAGGLDEKAKELLSSRFIHALGLPGKYAPESAGRIVFETVSDILRDKGVVR